ncbi:hypothetical protein GSY74_02430 [Sulfurovum sp. bin170]|uniref:hypothetical protein n=1 Tax=Sulfurovum sp. bin170 TaxID=2695268 RepID=UPI0013DFB313|nr:hypothetical protein [Sulfurovum sp. bin170]NEW60129.1 hypothetical protein [Sulfurovum sp. bin170]
MKYLIYISVLFFIVACGEQSFKEVDIRLLNSKESSESKEQLIVENNISKPIEKVIKDTNLSQSIKEESNLSRVVAVNSQKSKDLNSYTEINDSISVLVVENSSKSEELQLAELEAKMRAETLAMQSKYDISLKKLETDNTKVLKEKEVALAKLESDKEIAKDKELNRKELSILELESREKMALAKLESQKSLSQGQKELDSTEFSNNREIALAKLNNQKELVDKNIAFYKMIAMMVVGLVVLALLIIYFINRRKRKNELKIHEDELRHKEYMEASRQHNEHIGKMLDVITDANADKGVKKEIVRLLKDQGKKGNLIEHKR